VSTTRSATSTARWTRQRHVGNLNGTLDGVNDTIGNLNGTLGAVNDTLAGLEGVIDPVNETLNNALEAAC
jgi:ABC-type transporter Mla subunit MlaD